MAGILITGIGGEVGSTVALQLARSDKHFIIGCDLKDPKPHVRAACAAFAQIDISDPVAVRTLWEKFEIDTVFHFAAVLSSGGERNPGLAHAVNVTGTFNLFELARIRSENTGSPVKFIFTSTIAVYGLPNLEQKAAAGAISEHEFLSPVTMYGANKLYCERLGVYYSKYFGLLGDDHDRVRLDFRAVRFPGLLNAHTLPTGGTSDYAPEMVHAAAKGQRYICFVRADARIPFLMMPDAVRAVLSLADVPKRDLQSLVYNVAGFSPSAGEIAAYLQRRYPNCDISFQSHPERQMIVDSWPEAIDDSAARREWGWSPEYDFGDGFENYLLPQVRELYQGSTDNDVNHSQKFVANMHG